MSDKIIRLSGIHVDNSTSIQNFVSYIKKCNDRCFIICSSIPDIFNKIKSILHDSVNNKSYTWPILHKYYKQYTGHTPSSTYTKQTDQLSEIIKGITLLGDYSEALRDHILSYSEKLSAEILKKILSDKKLHIDILQPEEIELTVSPEYGNATYLSINKKKLNKLNKKIYLIPGSFGITKSGKTARAGNTASDYTAAFLSCELNAPNLELWGLAHNFYRTDKRAVPSSSIIKRLTYDEASELAYFDQYSIHPRTVEPLIEKHIPIYITNTTSKKREINTVINSKSFIEKQVVKSIASTDDISLLRLNGPGVGLKPGILAKVTSKLNETGINIKSVITSQVSINFILDRKAGEKAKEIIKTLNITSIKEILIIKDISLIAVIGHGMQHNYGVSAKIFNALAKNRINIIISGSGASDLVSYLVVKTSDKEISIREIYNEFFK